MDWNQYAKDIRQADANVQSVVSGGKISVDSLGLTKTLHTQEYDRLARRGGIIRSGGTGQSVLAVYYVDQGHRNGAELHWITDNAIIIITNALRNNGLDKVTELPARPQQLTRYTKGGNPNWQVCEQMFPDNDWRVPSWLLSKAEEHQRMGLNKMEESFMNTIKSGWKKIKKAFSDRPLVQLVDGDGQEEFGYIHSLDKKNRTCDFIMQQNVNENAVAASVAAALAMRNGSDSDNEEEYPYEPLFKAGEHVHLVGAEEELGSNDIRAEILEFEKCANLGIYHLKLET